LAACRQGVSIPRRAGWTAGWGAPPGRRPGGLSDQLHPGPGLGTQAQPRSTAGV